MIAPLFQPGGDPLLVWQLADSALPTGGFAHSSGLEAASHLGELEDSASLAAFLDQSLRQTGQGALPFVTEAHRSPEQTGSLDSLSNAFLSNHVSNRASRRQGHAFIAAATRIAPDVSELSSLRTLPFKHYAPTFGAVTACLGLDLDTARRLFLFLHLRTLISAAVRLNRVGPLHAQTLQRQAADTLELVLADSADLTLDDLAQTAPLHDLWQGCQDRLYSRLFQS